MAQLADEIINRLSPEQQRIARRIFLRLVQFGEGRAARGARSGYRRWSQLATTQRCSTRP